MNFQSNCNNNRLHSYVIDPNSVMDVKDVVELEHVQKSAVGTWSNQDAVGT